MEYPARDAKNIAVSAPGVFYVYRQTEDCSEKECEESGRRRQEQEDN
jgi:hypothetical protein